MEWVIVILGLLITFGGIVYVLPSRNERLRGKARLKARSIGLTVSSSTLANRDATSDEKVSAGGKRKNPVRLGFVYSKNYLEHLDNLPRWQLIPNAKSIHPFAGWELLSNEVSGVGHIDSNYWGEIENLCGSAPLRCFGISCNEFAVSWIGVEDLRDGDVEGFIDDVVEFLDRLISVNLDHVAIQEKPED